MLFLALFFLISIFIHGLILFRYFNTRKLFNFIYKNQDRSVKDLFGGLIDRFLESEKFFDTGDIRVIELPVNYCETGSKYSSIGDILQKLVLNFGTNFSLDSLLESYECVSQFQNILGINEGDSEGCKLYFSNKMIGMTLHGVQIDRAVIVPVGSLLDTGKMFFQTSGTRVCTSLHPVLYDKNGRVLRKSTVFCN